MEYTKQNWLFKLRKVLRYVRLYGPGQTLAKVRAQYHMHKVYDPLPKCGTLRSPKAHVGIVGCGKFAYSVIAYYLAKQHGAVIRAAMDHNIHRAASLYERFGLNYYT